ncbi:hypothetical protein D5086_030696 [Populus alba]|uniref:Uncharacterized protein n=1 Tax=Populus alba TaxID=43335 RepID=A0ACC4AP66_POPAL
MQMLHMQLEASEKFKTEYQKLYEDAINDLNKVSECYKSCITDLARKCSSLDDRYSCSLEMLDSEKQESLEWRRKYPNEEEARLADAHGKRPMNGKRTSSEADKEKNGSPAILGAQEKMDKYELESSALRLQLKDLTDKYESVQTAAHALEMEARILVQDRTQMEQKYS